MCLRYTPRHEKRSRKIKINSIFCTFSLEKSVEIEKVNQNEGAKLIRLKQNNRLEHWRRFAVAKLAESTIVIVFSRLSCRLGRIDGVLHKHYSYVVGYYGSE